MSLFLCPVTSVPAGSWLVAAVIEGGREVAGRYPGPGPCSVGPAHPPGQLSALLSLPRRLRALTLIDKNLILPPWPYKAWFPSPESLAGPLTFLISCSCLLLWCCFGRGQGGQGEWKHLAGQSISAPCLLSLQTLALACPCHLWPCARGGLAVGAELGTVSFSAGRARPCPPWRCSSGLCPTSLLLPWQAGALFHRCLGMGGREVHV